MGPRVSQANNVSHSPSLHVLADHHMPCSDKCAMNTSNSREELTFPTTQSLFTDIGIGRKVTGDSIHTEIQGQAIEGLSLLQNAGCIDPIQQP